MIFRYLDTSNIDESYQCIAIANNCLNINKEISKEDARKFNELKKNTIVCEENNNILGFGSFLGNNIDLLFVNASSQKQGIGKKILSTIEDIAQKQGYSNLKLIAINNSEHFYQKQGYNVFKDSSGDSIASKFLK